MRRVVSGIGAPAEFLARAIVNRLEDRGMVEFRDAEAAILIVTKALEQHLGLLGEEQRRLAAERSGTP